jgi:hypothetical protein
VRAESLMKCTGIIMPVNSLGGLWREWWDKPFTIIGHTIIGPTYTCTIELDEAGRKQIAAVRVTDPRRKVINADGTTYYLPPLPEGV